MISFLQLVGAAAVARFAFLIITSLWHRLRPAKRLESFGPWAVVTGCTDGIGKAIAEQLASKGFKLLLISRSADKLQQLKTELSGAKDIRTLPVDFSSATANDFAKLRKEFEEIEIGILVNNVGVSYEHPDLFHDVAIETHRAILTVNCSTMVELTHAVLPGMLQRKKGAIINVGSLLGTVPTALLATYGASKAFSDNFSQAIAKEYGNKGIVIQSCLPGMVSTKMSRAKRSVAIPSATDFAKAALRNVGSQPVRSVPFLPHAVQSFFIDVLPSFAVENGLWNIHSDLRRRALKKKGKAA